MINRLRRYGSLYFIVCVYIIFWSAPKRWNPVVVVPFRSVVWFDVIHVSFFFGYSPVHSLAWCCLYIWMLLLLLFYTLFVFTATFMSSPEDLLSFFCCIIVVLELLQTINISSSVKKLHTNFHIIFMCTAHRINASHVWTVQMAI